MEIFMKIFSAASAAALILGAGAFMHPATVKAALPPGYCQTLYADCQVGDQRACVLYNSVCTAEQPGSTVSGMPPAKSNGTTPQH
jgi:hypothetical protein